MRVVAVEVGLEIGFVGRAVPIVLRLVGEIEIGQPLHVGAVDLGDRRVGVVWLLQPTSRPVSREPDRTTNRASLMLSTPGTWQGNGP